MNGKAAKFVKKNEIGKKTTEKARKRFWNSLSHVERFKLRKEVESKA